MNAPFITGNYSWQKKQLRHSQCQRNFYTNHFGAVVCSKVNIFGPHFAQNFLWQVLKLLKKFLMMTIPACFPIPVAAHSSVRDVAVIPNQHNSSLGPIVAALTSRPLQGLSPVPVSPLLKWRTQRLNELIFMTSSSYTLLRRLWISVGLSLQ
jgi:hypothetical protein